MLDKTNFTTRTDISKEEAAALMTVRNKLLSGEIQQIYMESACGCIGYHMGLEMGLSWHQASEYVRSRGPMRPDHYTPLFYPGSGFFGELATFNDNERAVKAIDNFLLGSNTPWD